MVGLIRALGTEIRTAVENYKFASDGHEPKKISVYEQFIPRAHLDDPRGQFHPLIAVQCASVSDEIEGTAAEMTLTFGVYDESRIEQDGRLNEPWVDLLNLMETVRLRLLSKPVIGGRYRLIKPLETEIAEVQPAPFFYGQITARYFIYQAQDEGRIS